MVHVHISGVRFHCNYVLLNCILYFFETVHVTSFMIDHCLIAHRLCSTLCSTEKLLMNDIHLKKKANVHITHQDAIVREHCGNTHRMTKCLFRWNFES